MYPRKYVDLKVTMQWLKSILVKIKIPRFRLHRRLWSLWSHLEWWSLLLLDRCELVPRSCCCFGRRSHQRSLEQVLDILWFLPRMILPSCLMQLLLLEMNFHPFQTRFKSPDQISNKKWKIISQAVIVGFSAGGVMAHRVVFHQFTHFYLYLGSEDVPQTF